jgi:hypothetical protein
LGVDSFDLRYDILLDMQSSVGVSYFASVIFLEEAIIMTGTRGWDSLCGCAETSWSSEMAATEKVTVFILNV